MPSPKKTLNSPSVSAPTTGKSRNSSLTATTPKSAAALSTTTPTSPPAPTTSLSTMAAPAHTAAATDSGSRCRFRLHFFKEDKNSLFSSSFFLALYSAFVICLAFGKMAFLTNLLSSSCLTEKLISRDDLTLFATLACGKMEDLNGQDWFGWAGMGYFVAATFYTYSFV
jgi:hypothetical protein